MYNRPNHTKQTIESLQRNELASESELFIFSDGPKNLNDQDKVFEIREFIKSAKGFRNVIIYEKDKNIGLANSIIDGVTEIVNKYGKVIVLEDDLVTSKFFLKYMNEALEMYEHEEKVCCIHGYRMPIKGQLPETYFIKRADCWGWATWARGWKVFEKDGRKLLFELKKRKLTKEFDFNNNFGCTQMLESQINGGNNSWAIRWIAAAFLNDMLTLHPGRSLVRNVGFDGSGTHCDTDTSYDIKITDHPILLEKLNIEENKDVRKRIEGFYKALRPNFVKRYMNLIKRLIRKLIRLGN